MALQNGMVIESEASKTETKPGYKKTKLGWIPEDWEVKKIGDLAKIKHGRNQKEVVCDNGKYPILGTGGVIGWTNNYLYDKPSVMIGRKGTIDKPRFMTTPFWTVDTLFYTEIKDNTIPKWLFYNFQSINWYFYNEATGVPSLSASNISAIKILFPQKEEQLVISKCIDTWDHAIQTLTKLIAQKELQKKALMQQLLTGKKRLKGFSGEWKEYILSDIAKRVNRKNDELNDTVVTISAQRGFVLQEDFFNKRVASDTLLNYTLVHKGEYCYNKSYSNGYPMGAFKRLDDFEKAVVTTLYICFSLKANVDSDFMNQYFDAGKMIPGLMRIAQEGGRAHGLLNISLGDFFSLKLLIPNKEEQTAIATVLQNADKEISILNKKLGQLKEQKKGLMQQLLTGKKRLEF